MMSFLRCGIEYSRAPNCLKLVQWRKIVLLYVVALFPGCDLLNIEYRGNAATDLYPQEGILVIGRADDTLRGHVSTTWPRKTDGSYYTNDIFVTATTVTDAILFSANPGRHRGQIVPTETSEWKMWLYHDDIQPGTYMITIGASDELEPDTPGRDFKLFVLADTTFMLIVEPDTAAQFQGSTGTRIVRLIRAPGFTSPVRLSLRPQNGFTAVFQPETVVGDSSTMFLTVADTVAPRVYGLVVEGSGGGATSFAYLNDNVLGFPPVVRASPETLSLAAGQIGQITVSVSGPHLPVTLLEPTEPNVSFQFLPNPTDSLSTMTVTVAAQAQAGTRVIPIIGRFSNGQSARDTLILNIVPGLPWRTVFSQNGFSLFGLGFENSSTGFGMAVTQSAARSTDGGNSWTIVNPPPSNANDVAVVGPLRAVAVGGNNKIMRTYDGGLSWTERSSGLTSGSFLAIGFNPSNPNIGVAVGRDGVITRTTNGGDDWAAVSPENPDSPHWYDVSLFGPTGTIVGASSFGFNGTILRSTDYGLSWSLQATTTSGRPLNGVSFSNSNSGIIVGNDGVILRTDDGGAQWNTLISPTQAILYDVSMLSSQEATTVGSSGTILRTFDGGQTWVRQSVPPAAQSATLWKVFVFPNNSAVCLGNEFGCIILRRD